MGGLEWLMVQLVLPPAADAHGIAQAVLLMVLISAAMAIYGLLLALFGVVGWNAAVTAIRHGRPSDLRG